MLKKTIEFNLGQKVCQIDNMSWGTNLIFLGQNQRWENSWFFFFFVVKLAFFLTGY